MTLDTITVSTARTVVANAAARETSATINACAAFCLDALLDDPDNTLAAFPALADADPREAGILLGGVAVKVGRSMETEILRRVYDTPRFKSRLPRGRKELREFTSLANA